MKDYRVTNVIMGRPDVMQAIVSHRAQGLSIREIAAKVGINKSSVGRFLKEKLW